MAKGRKEMEDNKHSVFRNVSIMKTQIKEAIIVNAKVFEGSLIHTGLF